MDSTSLFLICTLDLAVRCDVYWMYGEYEMCGIKGFATYYLLLYILSLNETQFLIALNFVVCCTMTMKKSNLI